jgi:DNA polymerase-3 subunit beta
MADERSHAVRFHFEPNRLVISAESAGETEAEEILRTDYVGDETDIAFNAHFLHDFLGSVSGAKVTLHFKHSDTQAELNIPANGNGNYRYVVMPMRLGD